MAKGEAIKMGWVRPCDCTIKLNTYATIGGNKVWLGCVFRDENECVLLTGMDCKTSSLSEVDAELQAIIFSL